MAGAKIVRRIRDAHRLRTLWISSMTAEPALTESERISFVSREFVRMTPAGGLMYCESFRTTVPSERWIREALMGRLGNGVQDPRIGEPLLSTPARVPRVANAVKVRVAALEARVTAIEDGLGIPHA